MSEENRHSVSEELLFRYFLEEVSPSEQEAVMKWTKSSNENQNEFERVEHFLLDVKALNSIGKTSQTYNVESALSAVTKKNQTNASKPSLFDHFWKVAAVLILMAGSGWFYYQSLNPSKPIEQVALNDTLEVDLSDGTNITLNKNSQITYSDQFGKDERRVNLEGEAYFEVTHNPEKPFIIETGEVQVRVLGTSFNINSSTVDSVVVSVDTGRVQMTVSGKEEILTPGFKGIYYRSTQLLVKIENSKVGMHNYWRTKMMSFRGANVLEVIEAIHETYDVTVSISNKDIANCKISVDFEGESLENVLNIIGETLDLVWSKQDEAYLLAGNGCPQ